MNDKTIKIFTAAVKASADINRVRILNMLKYRKMCVCEIAFVLEISQPSVSRHLKKLKSAGFIEAQNERLWTNYYLCPRNAYAENFIKNLPLWLGPDAQIRKDEDKIHKADREKLCCI